MTKKHYRWKVITDDAGRPIRIDTVECRPENARTLDWDLNADRKGRAKLMLSRLPGLRVLSVVLTAHRSAAACAVWEAISSEQLFYEMTGELPFKKGETVTVSHNQISTLLECGMVALAWLFPPEECDEWRRRGFGDCDYPEYMERIENFRRQCEAAGAKPYLISCSVDFLAEAMKQNGVSTVPDVLHRLFLEGF